MSLQWYRTKQAPLASALVIHGLNNRPQAMVPLIEALTERSIECALLTLSGHGEALSYPAPYDYAPLWKANLRQYHPIFAREAASPSRALIAQSLGALLAQSTPELRQTIKAQVLLAPALMPRLPARLLDLLTRHLDLAIPSLAPTFIRRHQFLSSNFYRGLFSLLEEVGERGVLTELSTLLIASDGDELVDWPQLKKQVSSWPAWRCLTINPVARPYHWLLHPDQLGKKQWQDMLEKIVAHIK